MGWRGRHGHDRAHRDDGTSAPYRVKQSITWEGTSGSTGLARASHGSADRADTTAVSDGTCGRRKLDEKDAPTIAEVKKPAVKPVKTETVPVKIIKPIIKPIPKPSKSTSDALDNLLNGSNKSGDGNDKTVGNKGKANGDPNATGYNGGGGTGTGNGGGNGTGQGIGTGSGSGNGTGNGNGNYQLGNRKALNKPNPKYLCEEQGIVVVQITVDKTGHVISANPGARGTTNAAKCLLDQAKIAAMDTRWQADAAAPEKQVGKIIYNFKLTE